MKKLLYFSSLLAFSVVTSLHSHGFASKTLVRLADNNWAQIDDLYQYSKTHPAHVLSFDTRNKSNINKKITSTGSSKSNCYFCIEIDPHRENDILCTPNQTFYELRHDQWVPALNLLENDELLCKNGKRCKISRIQFISSPLDVFAIEVEETHTYYIGTHDILTHNFLIPISLGAGLSMSFGSGAIGGGAAGSFFGPAALSIGGALGGIIAVTVKLMTHSSMKQQYNIAFDVNDIFSHRSEIQSIHYEIEEEKYTKKAQNKTEKKTIAVASGGGASPPPPPHNNKNNTTYIPPEPPPEPETDTEEPNDFEKPDNFKESLDYATTDDKLQHFFDECNKHGFNDLLGQFGSKSSKSAKVELIKKILQKVIQSNKLPKKGFFKNITIELAGEIINTRGVVDKGVIKFGTIFIPARYAAYLKGL